MNRRQWKKAHHLARLATCIDPRVNAEEQAEAKAYRQLHELIQSGAMERDSFRAATRCVHDHRYGIDKLDLFRQRYRHVRQVAAAYPPAR